MNECISKSLGDELNLTLGYTLKDEVKLTAVYLQMFADKSMRYVKNITRWQK